VALPQLAGEQARQASGGANRVSSRFSGFFLL